MNEHELIHSVKYWIEKTIIGYNFCPFAKKEFESQRIHYEVVSDYNKEEQLHALVNELQRLDANSDIETTIIILPVGLESFFDYLGFLDIANQLLCEQNYEGTYQLASFHPDYCFENAKQEDAENYTNRSPYPLIHILREKTLEKVLSKYPEPEKIPQKNIQVARQNGKTPFLNILQESKSIY
ncbi:DUF1415 domain-containing protein [Aliikangiella sp. IMCC44359]|uniref:DUF1415 domain-containing protein n=1 Tax=Aliikangiella sp. IMCC44359 TaxID=3459125 RepID=UPI00403AF152